MCAIKSFLARVRFVVSKRLIKNLGSLNKGKRVLKEGCDLKLRNCWPEASLYILQKIKKGVMHIFLCRKLGGEGE
jgi:hypothetical protein